MERELETIKPEESQPFKKAMKQAVPLESKPEITFKPFQMEVSKDGCFNCETNS